MTVTKIAVSSSHSCLRGASFSPLTIPDSTSSSSHVRLARAAFRLLSRPARRRCPPVAAMVLALACSGGFTSGRNLAKNARMILKWCGILLSNAFGFALLLLATASAATVTVTNTNDTGAGSLRAALTNAAAGDTINFNLSGCPCTITTASVLNISKTLTISGPGPSQLTISGNNNHQVFTVTGAATSATISGLTVADGKASVSGGGLALSNAPNGSTTVSNCVLTRNSAPPGGGYGGAIFLAPSSTLTVLDSTFSGNSSGGGGGAIATVAGISGVKETVTLVNSTFTTNTAPVGGGVYVGTKGFLTSSNTTYTNNTASNSGGGIGIEGGNASIHGGSIDTNHVPAGGGGAGLYSTGIAELIGVAVTNNNTSASGQGGGIYSTGALSIYQCNISANQCGSGGGIFTSARPTGTSTLALVDSTIVGNSAQGLTFPVAGGGGIFIDVQTDLSTGRSGSNTATISGCTISGNSTRNSGGGIHNAGGVILANSTISGNQVAPLNGTAVGGGIYVVGNRTTNLSNCTIAFNTASSGGGILADANDNGLPSANLLGNTLIALNTASAGTDLSGTFVSAGYNFIGSFSSATASGFTNGTKGDIVGGSGAGAINPLLNPLADNGGPTRTHALQAGSPAIDKGNSAFDITTDQRGAPRFNDIAAVSNLIGGNASDIGAFEFTDSTLRITSITRPSTGHIILRGIGLPNAAHSVQAADTTPSPASFATIAPILSDPSGNLVYEDEDATSLADRFYRLSFP